MFYSITCDNFFVYFRLYLYEHEKKLTSRPTDKQTKQIMYEHLNTGMDGQCHGKSDCVEVCVGFHFIKKIFKN